MIKVLYNQDGTITDFWAIDEIPSSPYIEISEDQHLDIIDKDCYIVQNNEIFNISNTSEYITKKQEEETLKNQNEVKEQIVQIEAQQARALREVLLNNNEYSRAKLSEIDDQIQSLRSQL